MNLFLLLKISLSFLTFRHEGFCAAGVYLEQGVGVLKKPARDGVSGLVVRHGLLL